MTKRELGKAEYNAIRSGELVRLIAHGTAPNFNTKTDFEQMPFRTRPPQFGFFFITSEIVLPALKPFTYEESFPYPRGADHVTIIDADGAQSITIEELSFDDSLFNMPSRNEPGYCVFTSLGSAQQMIAQCDAVVLGIYSRSFGPATYGECLDYIATPNR